jgi:hypothetical protein
MLICDFCNGSRFFRIFFAKSAVHNSVNFASFSELFIACWQARYGATTHGVYNFIKNDFLKSAPLKIVRKINIKSHGFL